MSPPPDWLEDVLPLARSGWRSRRKVVAYSGPKSASIPRRRVRPWRGPSPRVRSSACVALSLLGNGRNKGNVEPVAASQRLTRGGLFEGDDFLNRSRDTRPLNPPALRPRCLIRLIRTHKKRGLASLPLLRNLLGRRGAWVVSEAALPFYEASKNLTVPQPSPGRHFSGALFRHGETPANTPETDRIVSIIVSSSRIKYSKISLSLEFLKWSG